MAGRGRQTYAMFIAVFASVATLTTAPLDDLRMCLENRAKSYQELRKKGEPGYELAEYAINGCWKEEALARLSLEPRVQKYFAEAGAQQPRADEVGSMIDSTIVSETWRVIGKYDSD